MQAPAHLEDLSMQTRQSNTGSRSIKNHHSANSTHCSDGLLECSLYYNLTAAPLLKEYHVFKSGVLLSRFIVTGGLTTTRYCYKAQCFITVKLLENPNKRHVTR